MQNLGPAAWPPDPEQVDLGGITETEMRAQVTRGKIAASAFDFADLRFCSYADRKPAADAVPVAGPTYRPNPQPVVLVSTVVSQEGGCPVDIVHENIDVAVVVEIAEGCATRAILACQSPTHREAHFFETCSALIHVNEGTLCVGSANVNPVHLGVHVPIRHEEIEPAIVIQIHKLGAPTQQEPRRSSNPGGPGDVIEETLELVVIELVCVMRK